MATRRLRSEDWEPFQPTKITIRKAREPRDERPMLPKSVQRARPAPINWVPGEQQFILKFSSRRPSGEMDQAVRDPEIIDVAAPNTWSRRGPPSRGLSLRRVASPSTASQYSVAQSEMSFGILDYYLKDPSPMPSPSLDGHRSTPRIETPVIDPAMEKFNFELTLPKSPLPLLENKKSLAQAILDTKAGAEGQDDSLLEDSLLSSSTTSQPERKETYSLFPRVKDNTLSYAPKVHTNLPRASITVAPSHQQPDPSYCPRKESVSGSLQTRKDSLISFYGPPRLPMRVLSSDCTIVPNTRSSASDSMSTASPPQQSRWSDDTVTSPGVVTTPGPRTSFGSLVGSSPQYPACFFEDDDDTVGEDALLRKKFRWQRFSNEPKAKRVSRFNERRSFGRRLVKVLLCCCCVTTN